MKNISIIIPFYNCSNELERLIESIGFHNDTEIIVINDKSNANLDKYESIKNRFKYCLFIDNESDKKGAGVCRNIGLSIANGKWLLFADADDYFVDGWYLNVNKYFESEADIVYYKPSCTSNNVDSRTAQYEKSIDNYFITSNELYLRYSFPVPWSKLVKNDLVKKNCILFDETRYSNDVMFSVKLGYYAKTIQVDKYSIYCLTEDNENSLTKQISFESLYIRTEILCNAHSFLKLHLTKDQFNRLLFGVPLKTILGSLLKYGYKDTVKLLKLFNKSRFSLVNLNFTNMRIRVRRKLNKTY